MKTPIEAMAAYDEQGKAGPAHEKRPELEAELFHCGITDEGQEERDGDRDEPSRHMEEKPNLGRVQ